MRNVEPTIEHLKKQIEFYRVEEDRVSKQLDEIQSRLISDREVLGVLEAEKKLDSERASIKVASQNQFTSPYTGIAKGLSSVNIDDSNDSILRNHNQTTVTL